METCPPTEKIKEMAKRRCIYSYIYVHICPSIDRSIALHRYILTHISMNTAIPLLVPSHGDVSTYRNN